MRGEEEERYSRGIKIYIIMIKLLMVNPIIGLILNNSPLGQKYSKYIGMLISIISLYIILIMNVKYNTITNDFQFRDSLNLYFYNLSLGLDGISLSILLIIGFIFPILTLLIIPYNYNTNTEEIIAKNREINNLLLIMNTILVVVFTSLDLFFFFIFFEVLLIPMFLLIGKFGSRVTKIEASYRFFLFTLIGSLILLMAIIILLFKYGTTNFELLQLKLDSGELEFYKYFFYFIWFSIFFSFLVKVPIFPLHSWLPEAHTEAPTIGSIILAAILLKLASFGIYRYSINMWVNSNETLPSWTPFISFIFILSIISILISSLTALRSIDLKKIIAYSSIAHMNFSIFGLFSNDLIGLTGASYLNFSHAFISSALFLLIGILYIRFHSRNLYYYKSLFYTMPLFSFFFIFFSLANMSIPFTSSFISELLILLSSYQLNYFISIILLFSILLSCCYILWLANRILFSHSHSYSHSKCESDSSLSIVPHNSLWLDLSFSEFLALFPMFIYTLGFGIYPKPLFNLFTLNLINLLS